MSKPQNSSDARKGFEVHSPLGPVWFVPYDKVEEDYAIFLEDADGLSTEQALAKARACSQEDIRSWFYEQFSWHEVERHGELLQPAKKTLISRSIRQRMLKIQPQHTVEEIGISA